MFILSIISVLGQSVFDYWSINFRFNFFQVHHHDQDTQNKEENIKDIKYRKLSTVQTEAGWKESAPPRADEEEGQREGKRAPQGAQNWRAAETSAGTAEDSATPLLVSQVYFCFPH